MQKFLVLVIGSLLAAFIIKFRSGIRNFTGEIGFAEKYLGNGGTNLFIVLLGIACFVLSLMYALGTLQSILIALTGSFF